ncbi:MAG: ABC transporter ATP-binding protein [Rhodocyclaceae bacterium]
MVMSEAVGLELRGVSVRYGGAAVLRDVSLDIAPGEFFALLGPSGSGKSTLLRLIAGFVAAESGTLRVGGEDITRLPPWKRGIGMVFQNYALWPHLTVARNVAFGLEERHLARAEIEHRVAEVLELVGMAEFAARRPGQLSGGQQQRVALARTLAVRPRLFLLDEPLSNLDAKLRQSVRGELRALQRRLGLTTVLVTHDQEEALTICDRVAVLEQGVIQQVGTPQVLFDRPANRFVADFIGSINFIPGIVQPAGAQSIEFASPLFGTHRLAAAGAAVRSGACVAAVRPHELGLAPARQPCPEGQACIPGTIRLREFLGEVVRYTVAAGEAELLVDVPHLAGCSEYEVDAPVAVQLPLRCLRILPA